MFTSPAGSDRRQRLLLVAAWTATLLPLIAFGSLTWESWKLNKQVKELEGKKASLQSEISQMGADLQAQRSSAKHYRDVTGIRIKFYRESDRAVVEKALEKLGFVVDANLGKATLIDRKPNTIAYGKFISEQDLRAIAVALVEAGFPLKRIAPAIKQPDTKLVQIYASAASDDSCGVMSVDQIRAGSLCGPRQQ